ncbi:hypothetical protein GA0115255_109572 [Streptomyces sp. Ncost-T6T-2b]|nr:hypothetical protein GA0115255_109572 [Streptomyces sp. Ncost-T6T-2b]
MRPPVAAVTSSRPDDHEAAALTGGTPESVIRSPPRSAAARPATRPAYATMEQ